MGKLVTKKELRKALEDQRKQFEQEQKTKDSMLIPRLKALMSVLDNDRDLEPQPTKPLIASVRTDLTVKLPAYPGT